MTFHQSTQFPMPTSVKQIKFENKTNQKSYFELIRIEELLSRSLDHDICQNHIVNFYIIFFVLEGKGKHTIDLVDYNYAKGDVLLIRKDQIHKFSRSTKVKGYLLAFTEEFIQSHLSNLEALKTLKIFNEFLGNPKVELREVKSELSSFTELVSQLDRETMFQDEYSEGIARSLLHVIITKLFRIKAREGKLSQKTKYLEEFIAFQSMVEQDCFKSKKVADYASRMAVSTKTLNKIVQSIVNKSAKLFIDEITITQIKRLLFVTNLSIKEIAFEAGFEDPANFSNYFKKFVGESPELFRQAHQ